MSKPKPPKPANDHLAAFGGRGDDLETLTDEELEARLQASSDVLGRQLNLRILRARQETLALLNARKRED
jgi:hypothetical protein